MQTLFDWLAIILFCAIAVTFLQRSVSPSARPDPIYHYIPPAIGCALANGMGNAGFVGFAALLLAATFVYYVVVLKPLHDFK